MTSDGSRRICRRIPYPRGIHQCRAAAARRPRGPHRGPAGLGVSVKSLLYRCRELGRISDSAASRGYQRLSTLQANGTLRNEPTTSYPGEMPALLSNAFDLAEDNGLTLPALADELAWYNDRVRTLLSRNDAPVSSRLLKRVLYCKRRHIFGFVRGLGMLATCVTGDTGARSSAMSPPMRRHSWAHISALATSALDAVREEAHADLTSAASGADGP